MINRLKKIISTITAAATMLAVGSAFASCGKNATTEDKYLNLPDEPIIFWKQYQNCYPNTTTKFNSGNAPEGRIYSKTPIDVTTTKINLNDSFFYYASGLEEVYNYQTDSSEKAGVELFMEYNGADWEELLNLYNDDKDKYSEEIENWQTRYEAVKENISLYVYKIIIKTIDEVEYNAPTELSTYYKNLYDSGALKLYAPETDKATTLTTATFYIGDKVITHQFGEYSEKENVDRRFVLNAGTYNAGVSFKTYKEDGNTTFYRDGKSAMGELFIIVYSGEVAETREWFDVTLKNIVVLDNDFITIEPTEVKYISALGVSTSAEWDGGELTFKARNRTKEDVGDYAFAVYFNINSSHAISSYANVNIYLNVSLSVDGTEGDVFSSAQLPRFNQIGGEYYAYMVDGVDVLAREKVWGYGTKRMNDAASNWENHIGWEAASVVTYWDDYAATGSFD